MTGDAGKSSVEWESAKQRLSRLEMENERLKSENERLRSDLDRSQSTFGRSQMNVTQEAERIQERLDKSQVLDLDSLTLGPFVHDSTRDHMTLPFISVLSRLASAIEILRRAY